MNQKKNKADKIIFICRHTKKPVKQGECFKCWHGEPGENPKDKESDPRSCSHEACKKFNAIAPEWIKNKQEEFKKNPRKLAIVQMMDLMMKQSDVSVKAMEEALLLIRLELKI